MARRMTYPRNEASRRDRIVQHQIIHGIPRSHAGRNDAIAANPYGNPLLAIALSGTAISGGVLEAEVVTGGETVIFTLTGDTWQETIGADNAITTAFLAAITGDDSGGNGWDDEVALVHGNLVRTSSTVLTLTLPASASYSVAADETVTVAVPAGSVTKGIAPASKTFDVSIITVALSGTMVAGGVLESEIVTGSETLIITLTGDTWAATIGADNAITDALIAGITGDDGGANGWDDEVAILFGVVTRTSDTVVTIVLPAAASYAVAADEDVTVALPASALTLGVIPATPAVVVITEGS